MEDDNEINVSEDTVCELYDNQEVYIRNLKELIREQNNLIRKLRNEISLLTGKTVNKDSATQTEVNEHDRIDNGWIDNGLSVEENVKKVAENAMNRTSFVYDTTSGLYYDYNTGYYYDAERCLYYDGNSGIYYYYDQETNSFNFHSQVTPTQITTASAVARSKENNDLKSATKRKIRKEVPKEDYEEGECSSDSDVPVGRLSEDENENSNEKETEQFRTINEQTNSYGVITKDASLDESIKAWPPCMRIIVQETKVENLDVGTLFIVTYQGGTIGREGEHSVLIPDKNISKYHAKLAFDEDGANEVEGKGNYVIVDLGSRNGTYLDGKRLSSALQESEPHPVTHKSCIRVGGTLLVCHVHLGRETCSECEPGLILPSNKDERHYKIRKSEKNLNKERAKNLKEIKKKFGLESAGSEIISASIPPEGYEDKAEIRRKTVGSSCEYFKTETASSTQHISKTNAGYKMLSKMGWKKGDSLGTSSAEGMKDPISVDNYRSNKSGLGYGNNDATIVVIPDSSTADAAFRKKQEIWRKTRRRYKDIVK